MNSLDIVYLLIVFACILVSMTLHEAMHAFVSYWLGDDTAKSQGRLTLNPFAHIDPVTTVALPLVLVLFGLPPFGAAKPVPFNPSRVRFGDFGAALVGIAGPFTNLVLAATAGGIMQLAHLTPRSIFISVLVTFGIVNISFFVFNMIPFPPLDGSRLLYAIAPDFIRDFMERIEGMGFSAIILFMLVFYAILITPFSQMVTLLSRLLLGL